MLGQAMDQTASRPHDGASQRWRARADHLIREWDSKLLIGILFLIAVDVSFVAIYALHEVYISLYNYNVPLLDFRWNVGDYSYAEMFGYAKAVSIVILLIIACHLSGKWMYLIWAGVFMYVLLDDALLIHERLGRAVAGPSSSTWAWDMGQLAVWIVVGMILLAITVGSLVRSSGRDRTNGILLLVILFGLGFFAVPLDLVHATSRSWFRGANLLFDVIEEGGEQLMLSLAVALAVLIQRSKLKDNPHLSP